MSDGNNSKRWLVAAAVVAGVGLLVFLVVAGILVGVGVPAWRNAVVARNEAATVTTLQTIALAQDKYLRTGGRYATFAELYASGALDARFNSDTPLIEGYLYTMKTMPQAQGRAPLFMINADPEQSEGATATGRSHFYIDSHSEGFVRFNREGAATADDPIVK